jgi:hypothetical protein
MTVKSDPASEIQGLFLARDEIASMILDRVFAVVDEQLDLAEQRIRRGEKPAVVFAAMRDAMRRMQRASYRRQARFKP